MFRVSQQYLSDEPHPETGTPWGVRTVLRLFQTDVDGKLPQVRQGVSLPVPVRPERQQVQEACVSDVWNSVRAHLSL